VISGNNQTGVVGMPLAAPMVVQTDEWERACTEYSGGFPSDRESMGLCCLGTASSA